MNGFDVARQFLADRLTAAGAEATLDPAGNVPMILVDLATVLGAAGPGGWSARIPVRIVVPPPGDLTAATALGDLLEVVLATLGAQPANPGTHDVGGVPCPAYTITYPVDIPDPTC